MHSKFFLIFMTTAFQSLYGSHKSNGRFPYRIAVKKYWIISRVVEVITSQSNEIYHEWPKATSDKFITLTSDYLNHK